MFHEKKSLKVFYWSFAACWFPYWENIWRQKCYVWSKWQMAWWLAHGKNLKLYVNQGKVLHFFQYLSCWFSGYILIYDITFFNLVQGSVQKINYFLSFVYILLLVCVWFCFNFYAFKYILFAYSTFSGVLKVLDLNRL